MANKKINELDSRASLSLSDLMAVGDPSTGYLYKTTISDLKTLTGAGVISFNGRFGAVSPAEGDYTLTQLSDVIITSATNGNILQYNGSNWVNVAAADLSGFVPYTGATSNVNLGTYDLSADIVNVNDIKALTSGGLDIYSNSGTHIALMGGGGGAGTTFYGGLIGTTGSFSSSGGSNTFSIEHSSGSGIALSITKGGNGEGIYVNKTSGSGNAATIVGTLEATTLVKTGGTSSQFLKADGSVDSNTYVTLDTNQTISGIKIFTSTIYANEILLSAAGTASQTFLKNLSTTGTVSTGANLLGFNTDDNFYLASDGKGYAVFAFNNSGTGYTYTLPATSGTVALTSNLSSYLPLAGGTLTGTLNGTSILLSSTGDDGLFVDHGGARGIRINSYSSGYGLVINNASGATSIPFIIQTSGATRIQVNANGTSEFNAAMTLNAALSGTSATFSGNVAINSTIQSWGTPFANSALQLGFSGFIAGRSDSINQLQLGTNAYFNGTSWIYRNTNAASRYYQVDGSHIFSYAASGTAGNAITFIDALTLSSTGAATFSSQVAINGSSLDINPSSGNSNITLRTANVFEGYIQAITGGGILFGTGSSATERMRITSGGNVGIGTSSPAYPLQVRRAGGGGSLGISIDSVGATDRAVQYFAIQDSASGAGAGHAFYYRTPSSTTDTLGLLLNEDGNVGIGTSSPSRRLSIESSDIWMSIKVTGNREYLIGQGTSDALRFFDATADAERMRITSGGQVGINTTSFDFGEKLGLYSTTSYTLHSKRSGTGSEGHFAFSNANGGVGSIFTSGSSTFYNATSDYRLKQDLKDYNGLNLISAIKTYDYEWKSDKTRMYGVIAHELAEVIPYCVTGEKDAEMMQQVDYSKLVPVLVKAIQELKSELDTLKTK
jgi:hypothetical protein